MNKRANIHFSDFFGVDPGAIEEYGAFNVSLISDLPLFVDPFLLFNSDKPEYRDLHESIITYLVYLRDRSAKGEVSEELLRGLYYFGEVKENWLGFCQLGNHGSGPGIKFARALNRNLHKVFSAFGNERVTRASHLEKICLIESGVGRDNISDFTTNLIKGFLAEYTQTFAKQFLDPSTCGRVMVERVSFNYDTGVWNAGHYYLPVLGDNYVLLTPKDMLTKDDTWISRHDMLRRVLDVMYAMPSGTLRAHLNEYLLSRLAGVRKEKDRLPVYESAIRQFPEIIDYYIKMQEESGECAVATSGDRVQETQSVFVTQLMSFVEQHLLGSTFYRVAGNTIEEARQRVAYLKQVIENNDGYRLFYANAKPIRREEDVQLLYLLTWYASPSDVNREVNNGRGPVDFKISQGKADKSLVEFKLASNSQLKRNLQKQVEVYEAANQTWQSLKVIVYFTEAEAEKVALILKELGLESNPNIILIDARGDNKPSASRA